MTGVLGQVGRSTAVLAAGSLLAALGLSACGTDVAKAATVLRDARATTLQLPDGSTRAASSGTTVPKGATVTTGPGGSVSLVTAGRVVLLGSETAVSVYDGRRERLRKGLVMIDARKAGDLDLDAGAATVRTARGTLARVERGPLLRVASFRRGATVRATGRRAQVDVPQLKQVQVPFGGAPGQITALGLTRDRWEKRYALELVTSDLALDSLAKALDANATSSSAVVSAASFSPGAVAGERASERSLGLLVAGVGSGGSAQSRYERVRTYREEGGSWGVVAALVGADAARVSGALDALLAPTEPVLAVEPGNGSIDVGGLLGVGGNPGASPAPGPSAASGSSPRPVRSPSPRPSSSPSPDPVERVVTTVQSLLPTPLPSLPALPVAPLASPSPLLTVHVGGVTLGIG
jgi:hypothetical protein